MKPLTIILLVVAMLAFANKRPPVKSRSKWFQHLSGSQKIFGAVAFVLVLVILINPEFLALGFLGDTALFDMLVLAIGLQMHTYVTQAVRLLIAAARRSMQWAGIPSPSHRYLIAVSSIAITSAVTVLQKAVHRLIS